MIKVALLLTFLFSSLARGKDCHHQEGEKKYVIKDGEKISLLSKGKSLEGHKIQDQDGLSTCYANAMSVLLKSTLKDHPDISYIHGAIVGSIGVDEDTWNKGKGKYKRDNGETFIDFGYFCPTFEALKKSGGACNKGHSLIENTQQFDPEVQMRLFSGLGKFFDLLNNNSEVTKEVKIQIDEVINKMRFENDKIRTQCENIKKERIPSSKAFENIVAINLDYYQRNPGPCNNKKSEILKKILSPDSIITEDKYKISLEKNFEKELSQMFNDDEELSVSIEEYFKSHKNADNKIISQVELKLNSILKKYLPDSLSRYCDSQDTDVSPYLYSDELKRTFSNLFLIASKRLKNDPCQDYVSGEFIKDYFTSSIPQCTHAQYIVDAIMPLLEITKDLDLSLNDKLNSLSSINAGQIMQILTPACLEKKNLISLDSLECSTHTMCDSNVFGKSKVYSGKKDGCYESIEAQNNFRSQVFSSITQNRSVGINSCAAFLEDSQIRTNFCKNLPKGVDDFSFHIMAISGVRCRDGVLDYEIINSWGDRCSDDKGIECQRDENNFQTGVLWINEEILVNNTRSLHVIKEGQK